MRCWTTPCQVLPSRLRNRVAMLQEYTVPVGRPGPTVDPSVLTTIAATCRDHERLRFDYRNHDGAENRRTVEPHRLAGADTLDLATVYIAMLDVDFDVLEPPELVDHLRKLAGRYLRAAESSPA